MCRAVILYQECSNGGQTGSKAVNKARMKIANQGKNHPFVITKERLILPLSLQLLNSKMILTAEIQILNENMIVAVVIAI